MDMNSTPFITMMPREMMPVVIDMVRAYIININGTTGIADYISQNATTIAFIMKYLIDARDKSRIRSWLLLVPPHLYGVVINRDDIRGDIGKYMIDKMYGTHDTLIASMIAGNIRREDVMDKTVSSMHIIEASMSFRDVTALTYCRDSGRWKIALIVEATRAMNNRWVPITEDVIKAAVTPESLHVVHTETAAAFIGALLRYYSGALIDHYMMPYRAALQPIVDKATKAHRWDDIWLGCLYITTRGYIVDCMALAEIERRGHTDILIINKNATMYLHGEEWKSTKRRLITKRHMLEDKRMTSKRIRDAIMKAPVSDHGNTTLGKIHDILCRPDIERCDALADVLILSME